MSLAREPRPAGWIWLTVAATLSVTACKSASRENDTPEPPPSSWMRCGGLPANQRDSCFATEGTSRAEPRPCRKVRDRSRRDRCLRSVAEARLDPWVCRRIKTDLLRTGCLDLLARRLGDHRLCADPACVEGIAVDRDDPALCRGINVPDSRDDCLASLARARNDAGLCQDVQDPRHRDRCYSVPTPASAKEATTICSKIVDASERSRCYQEAAEQLPEPRLCNALVGEEAQRCRDRIVTNATDCSGLGNPVLVGRCFAALVRLVGDPALCATVKNDEARVACQREARK